MGKPNRYTVVNDIKDKISNGQLSPGDKLDTTSEIASRYSVALATAQAALKQLTEEGLITRLPGKGTYIAQSDSVPENAQVREVAIIGPTDDKYYLELFFKLIIELKKEHIDARCLENDISMDELDKIVKKKPLAIVLQNHTTFNELRAKYPDQQLIYFNAVSPYRHQTHIVCTNQFTAAYNGVKHLFENGYRKIACLCNAGDMNDAMKTTDFVNNDYVAGYHRAIVDHKLDYEKLMSYRSVGTSERIVRKTLASGDVPDAIVSNLDHRSKEFIEIAAELNLRVPDDIAIVSNLNSIWADVYKLSSFDAEKEKMVNACMGIINQIKNDTIADGEYICRHITPKLIIRESSRKKAVK